MACGKVSARLGDLVILVGISNWSYGIGSCENSSILSCLGRLLYYLTRESCRRCIITEGGMVQ
jgi:hypothetical protein